jgi:hypothetical protein
MTVPSRDGHIAVPRTVDPTTLDLRAWDHVTPTYDALGFRFRLRCDDPVLARWAMETFGSLRSEGPGDTVSTYSILDRGEGRRQRFALYRDGTRVGLTRTLTRLGYSLLADVNAGAVRSANRTHVVFHAAMAEREGVGVLLPAPMESGKTTTVTGLVRAGFRYLTDEAAALSPQDLTVTAFPKALSVDRGSWSVFPDLARPTPVTADQWQVPPTDLRPDAVVREARPRLVVRPRYLFGSSTRLRRVPRPEMALLLADCTFHFVDGAARNLETIAAMLARAECYELTIGSLEEAVVHISRLVDAVTAEEDVA